MSKQSDKSHETSALVAGIAAFTTWGLVPIYWKLLKTVPAAEILAHRLAVRLQETPSVPVGRCSIAAFRLARSERYLTLPLR